MIHVIKQINKNFKWFISYDLLDSSTARDVSKEMDTNNTWMLSRKEVTEYISKLSEISNLQEWNKKTEAEIDNIKKTITDAWNNNHTNKGISVQKFEQLISTQEEERKGVDKKYLHNKKEINKKGVEHIDKESMNIVIDFAKDFNNLKWDKSEVYKLQLALLKLAPKSLPTYGADKDLWNETIKAMNKIVKEYNKTVNNKTNTSNDKEENSFVEWISDFIWWVVGAISTVWNTIEDAVTNAWDAIWDAVTWGDDGKKLEKSKDSHQYIIANFDLKNDRTNKSEVIKLQKALKKVWYDLWTYWPNRDWIDGGMSLNWKTMKAYKSALPTYKNIENTDAVKDFADAYSNQYSSFKSLFNTKDWLIGQVLKYTTDSDASDLKKTLWYKYERVDKKLVTDFAKELGIKEDSPEYDRYLNKTLIEAGVSALVSYIQSGWNSVSAIMRITWFNPGKIANIMTWVNNIAVRYEKAPTTEQILDVVFWKGEHDYKKTAKDAYINWMSTNVELKDTLNSYLDVDINNVRRIVRELGWYTDLSGIPFVWTMLNLVKDLIWDDFEDLVRELEEQRDWELNIEKVDDIMWKIWLKILEPLKKEIAKGWKNAEIAKKSYNELASILWRYTNLEQKFYSINGGLTAKAKADIAKDEGVADSQLRNLGYSDPKVLNEKLLSGASYGFNVEKSIAKYWREWYVKRLAETSYVKNWPSMLATIAATLTEKTQGLSFSMDVLVEAMKNIKKVENSDVVTILSNLSRSDGQKFQWSIDTSTWKGTLYSTTDRHWITTFYKWECNNPVAIVNKLTGTLLYADSQGIHLKVNLKKEEPPKEPTPEKEPEKKSEEENVEQKTESEEPCTETWTWNENTETNPSSTPNVVNAPKEVTPKEVTPKVTPKVEKEVSVPATKVKGGPSIKEEPR